MVNKEHLKPYIPLVLALAFGLILFFMMENFITTVIVQPLLKVAWFAVLILDRFPQGGLWIGFILFLLGFTLTSLKREHHNASTPWQTNTRTPGTVEQWTKFLTNAQHSPYSKWRLAQHLEALTRDLIPPTETNHIKKGELDDLDLPVEIRAYFEAPLPTRISRQKWFMHRTKKTETVLDLDPEVVYQFLQGRLSGKEMVDEDQRD